MNSDEKIDLDLRRLGRAMSPDDAFVDRVMRKIENDSPAGFGRFHRRWSPIGFAVAASVVVVFGLVFFSRRSEPTATPQPLPLVRTSSQWEAVSQRAVILGGELPAREISRESFERVVLTDPQRHATFERIVPREQVKFVTLEKY